MLKNAPFLITIGVDTAENEPRKESWVVARTGVSILMAEPWDLANEDEANLADEQVAAGCGQRKAGNEYTLSLPAVATALSRRPLSVTTLSLSSARRALRRRCGPRPMTLSETRSRLYRRRS